MVRARRRVEVRQDPAEALVLLLDPAAVLDEAVAVEVGYTELAVTPVAGAGTRPAFGELFGPDPDPEAWWVTPRTAALLHQELSFLADLAYDDVETLSEEPVDGEAAAPLRAPGWLPEITWPQRWLHDRQPPLGEVAAERQRRRVGVAALVDGVEQLSRSARWASRRVVICVFALLALAVEASSDVDDVAPGAARLKTRPATYTSSFIVGDWVMPSRSSSWPVGISSRRPRRRAGSCRAAAAR